MIGYWGKLPTNERTNERTKERTAVNSQYCGPLCRGIAEEVPGAHLFQIRGAECTRPKTSPGVQQHSWSGYNIPINSLSRGA